MCDSKANKYTRVIAYVAAAILIFLGVMGLMIEISKAKPSSTNFYGYVLAVEFIACGVLTCLGVWADYGGGIWSFLGLLLVAAFIGRVAFLAQTHMRGGHLLSPFVFFSTTAVLWAAGCYCLFWGHLRRHKRQQNQPP